MSDEAVSTPLLISVSYGQAKGSKYDPPLNLFATYGQAKGSKYDPPLNLFATYGQAKGSKYDPPMYVFVTYADNVPIDPDPEPDPEPDIPEGEEMRVVTKQELRNFYVGIKKFFANKTTVDKQFTDVNNTLKTKVDLNSSKHIQLPDGTEIWVE